MQHSYENLPDNLPVPVDDGACTGLVGKNLPNLDLQSTSGGRVNLSNMNGCLVVYCYPMTGRPGIALPAGWDDIPGARGCTPQSCAFRDRHAEILALNAQVFGVSTQSTEYQNEMAERLHLPFPVLSDHRLEFCEALGLPTFTVEGNRLLKRVTMISRSGVIEAVHYPVFPSDADPQWVIQRLTVK